MLIIRRLIWIIIITFLCVIVANAQSQRPAPSLEEKTKPIQKPNSSRLEKATEKQYGTEQSPFVVKTISPPKTQEIYQDRKDRDKKSTNDRRLVIFTGVIACIALFQFLTMIAQVIAMATQARILQETVAQMRDTAIRQLRTYIFVDKAIISNVAFPVPREGVKIEKTPAILTRPNEGPLVYLEFKNSGQTPAYDVITWGDICIREFPLTSTLPTKETKGQLIAKASIPPGVGTNKHNGIEKPLAEGDIEKLRVFPPTAAIYVYGSISYRDTFGIIRTTDYRYFHNSLSGILGQYSGMSICDEGNEAD